VRAGKAGAAPPTVAWAVLLRFHHTASKPPPAQHCCCRAAACRARGWRGCQSPVAVRPPGCRTLLSHRCFSMLARGPPTRRLAPALLFFRPVCIFAGHACASWARMPVARAGAPPPCFPFTQRSVADDMRKLKPPVITSCLMAPDLKACAAACQAATTPWRGHGSCQTYTAADSQVPFAVGRGQTQGRGIRGGAFGACGAPAGFGLFARTALARSKSGAAAGGSRRGRLFLGELSAQAAALLLQVQAWRSGSADGGRQGASVMSHRR
jgi:hypothetical protein